jgi:hypothetical protein
MPKNAQKYPPPPHPPQKRHFFLCRIRIPVDFLGIFGPPPPPPQKTPQKRGKITPTPSIPPSPLFLTHQKKYIFYPPPPPSPTPSNTIPPSHTPPSPPAAPPIYIIISTCFLPVSAKRVFCATHVFTNTKFYFTLAVEFTSTRCVFVDGVEKKWSRKRE